MKITKCVLLAGLLMASGIALTACEQANFFEEMPEAAGGMATVLGGIQDPAAEPGSGGGGKGAGGGSGEEVDTGCNRGHGYWGDSPAGERRALELVPDGMTIGEQAYSMEELDSIFAMPAEGNALVILAYQLIAAKLNVLDGASIAPVAGLLDDADNLIGTAVIPPVGGDVVLPSSELGQKMVAVAMILDGYNHGRLGGGVCPR